jgi:hypothetical protein
VENPLMQKKKKVLYKILATLISLHRERFVFLWQKLSISIKMSLPGATLI